MTIPHKTMPPSSSPSPNPRESWDDVYRDLDQRLQKEHATQLWALKARATIALCHAGDSHAAYSLLENCLSAQGGPDERRQCAALLMEAGERTGQIDHAGDKVREALGSHDPFVKLLAAQRCLSAGDLDGARAILEPLTEEHAACANTAISLLAQIAVRQERWSDARLALERLFQNAETYAPRGVKASILRDLLTVVVKQQDSAGVLSVIGQIEKLGLVDAGVRWVKAQALACAGKLEQSNNLLRRLIGESSSSPDYNLLYARNLTQIGKPEEALRVLEKSDAPDPKCLAMLAFLKKALAGPGAALLALKVHRDKVWNQPDLLLQYIEAAYAAGQESEAQAAFDRVLQLQKQGCVGTDRLQSKSVKEVENLFRDVADHTLEMEGKYRLAQVPRDALSQATGTDLYLDWCIRTQGLPAGLSDQQFFGYSTYATDFVRSVRQEAIAEEPLLVQVPDEATEIVIDYDALISLDRLGLMAEMQRRFGKITYISDYLTHWMYETGRLQPRQLSQAHAILSIQTDMQAGVILAQQTKCQEKYTNAARAHSAALLSLAREYGAPLVDSYGNYDELDTSGTFVLGVKAFAQYLFQKGLFRADAHEEVKRFSDERRPAECMEGELRIIDAANCLAIDGVSLGLIYAYGMADGMRKLGKKIVVSSDDAARIKSDALSYRAQQDVLAWQQQLTQRTVRLPPFEPGQLRNRPKQLADDPSNLTALAIMNVLLAREEQKWLFTDDRFKLRLYERSFSIDAVLADLAKKGFLTAQAHAEKFLQLCRWRYRFLIPTVEVLLYFARQYVMNLPAPELVEIARYANDCMRDPGLSMVPDHPKSGRPVGATYWLCWLDILTDFIQCVTEDDKAFTEDAVISLVRWAWQECLPPLPPGADRDATGKLDELVIHKVFSRNLTQAKRSRRWAMAVNETLCCLIPQESVHETFCRMICEVTETIGTCFGPGEDEAKRECVKGVLANLMTEERMELTPLLALKLQELGLEVLETPNVDALSRDRKAISSLHAEMAQLSDWKSDSINNGPLKIVGESPSKHLLVPHDLLDAPAPDLREAGLQLVLSPPEGGAAYVTKPTAEKLKRLRSALSSEHDQEWRIAAFGASSAMLHDIKYAQTAFGQVVRAHVKNIQRLADQIAGAVWRPDPDSIVAELPPTLAADWSRIEISNALESCIAGVRPDERHLLEWSFRATGLVTTVGSHGPIRIVLEAARVQAGFPTDVVFTPEVLRSMGETCSTYLVDEIRSTDDPVVVRAGIAVLLALRPFVPENHRTEYLRSLLCAVLDRKPNNHDEDPLALSWDFLNKATQYFMHYLDANARDRIPQDERRASVAWWLGWRVMRLANDASKPAGDKVGVRTHLLRKWIEQVDLLLSEATFLGLFPKGLSGQRFRQMTCFVESLPSLVISAMASPEEPIRGMVLAPSAGLAVNPPILDRHLAELVARESVISGFKAESLLLQEPPPAVLEWNWLHPACRVGPQLIRASLGGERTNSDEWGAKSLQLAEALADPTQWDQFTFEVGAEPKEESWAVFVLASQSLGRRSLLGHPLDKNIKALLGKPVVWQSLPQKSARVVTNHLALAIIGLLQNGHHEDATWLAEHLSSLDIAKLDDETASDLVRNFVLATVVGLPNHLLVRVLVSSKHNHTVKRALHSMRLQIAGWLPLVPSSRRSEARLTLTTLREYAAGTRVRR